MNDIVISVENLSKRYRLGEIGVTTLRESAETDPVRLLAAVFRLPGLKMHGPEYHSIVPAVLVTAAGNLAGERKPRDIAEAIRDSSLQFDQLIFEGTWVHVAIPAAGQVPRREVLTARFSAGSRVQYLKGIV